MHDRVADTYTTVNHQHKCVTEKDRGLSLLNIDYTLFYTTTKKPLFYWQKKKMSSQKASEIKSQ